MLTGRELEKALGLARREDFVAALKDALERGAGFAAGKLGVSERAMLRYPIVLKHETDQRRLKAFEVVLAFKSLPQSGIFPPDAAFYRRWADSYIADVRNLDSVGLFRDSYSEIREIVRHHALDNMLVDFKAHEPDRSSPSDESRCYLRYFRGRRVLLVCPFAEWLRGRATKETFEAVWAKTGKPWFYPHSVEALEFPYGFERATQERYGSAFTLLDELKAELARIDFEVALIAAGGLGIPLASFVKDEGKDRHLLGRAPPGRLRSLGRSLARQAELAATLLQRVLARHARGVSAGLHWEG